MSDLLVEAGLAREVTQLISEGVSNAVRHGRATHVWITAAATAGDLRLEIQDNGCGFPVPGRFGQAELQERGLGPKTLLERVSHLKGSVHVHSAETGLRVEMSLPLGQPRRSCAPSVHIMAEPSRRNPSATKERSRRRFRPGARQSPRHDVLCSCRPASGTSYDRPTGPAAGPTATIRPFQPSVLGGR
jgi:hypothetical protein